jgi:hypothetical protein
VPTPPQLLQKRRRYSTPTLPSPQSLHQRRGNHCRNATVVARQRCRDRNPCANAAKIAEEMERLPHAKAAVAAIPAPTATTIAAATITATMITATTNAGAPF